MNKLQILVTRPYPAGAELCDLIQHQGDQAIYLPTIEFAPPNNLEKLNAAMQKAGQQDWLIFISPQAVYSSIPLLRRTWPELPPTIQFAAVGAGTAKAALAAGYRIHTFPQLGGSEALLALPEFQTVDRKKIGIIRGEGGRDLLEKTLKLRGAEILSMMTYQRLRPILTIEQIRLFKDNKIDVSVATSCEAVQNLKMMLGNENWFILKTIPLITISKRIQKFARDLGFQTIWLTPDANHQSILELLAIKRKELCQSQAKK